MRFASSEYEYKIKYVHIVSSAHRGTRLALAYNNIYNNGMTVVALRKRFSFSKETKNIFLLGITSWKNDKGHLKSPSLFNRKYNITIKSVDNL